MMTETTPAAEQPTSSLIAGIIEDMQRLLKQQFLLTRREVISDVQKAKEAVGLYAAAGGAMLLAGVSLCAALALLLHWATTPPANADPASLPMWACFGIVGLVLGAGGIAAYFAADAKWRTINPLEGPAVEELKRNVDAIT